MPKQEDKTLRELKAITRELKAIKKELEEDNVPFWRLSLKEFGTGIFKGVGLIIGTTVVAAIVILLLQWILNWEWVQALISTWISEAVNETLRSSIR